MLTSQNSSDGLELNFQKDIENINQVDGISKLMVIQIRPLLLKPQLMKINFNCLYIMPARKYQKKN